MKNAGRVFLSGGVILSMLMLAIAVVTVFKIVTPLAVISGSMEPDIPTGSLIIAVKTDAASLRVGEIATLPRNDGILVTHRIVSNEPLSESDVSVRMIRMKGDANSKDDQYSYIQSEALRPYLVIPAVGSIATGLNNYKSDLMIAAISGVSLYLLIQATKSRRNRRLK